MNIYTLQDALNKAATLIEAQGDCFEPDSSEYTACRSANLIIQAAPALLAALKAVCEWAGGEDWREDSSLGEIDQFDCFKQAAKAIDSTTILLG